MKRPPSAVSSGPRRGQDVDAAMRRERLRHPGRANLDPFAVPRFLVEEERVAHGAGTPAGISDRMVSTCSVFLVGAECPFRCVYCDLWKHTLTQRTPVGAIPAQLRGALRAAEGLCEAVEPGRFTDIGSDSDTDPDREREAAFDTVKLYNSSNFFDARAVPLEDDAEILQIAASIAGLRRLVVESHPRLVVAPRCEAFAYRLRGLGARLEVALGLESADPRVFSQLDKGCSLRDFERAFSWLQERDVATRVFVLVGLPFSQPGHEVSSVLETVRWAARCDVESVSLIPVRATEALRHRADDQWREPTLEEFESCVWRVRREFDVAFGGPLVVRADLWDLDRLRSCPDCVSQRRSRLLGFERAAALHSEDTLVEIDCARCGMA